MRLLPLLMGLLLLASPAAAEVYTWVDEAGVTHRPDEGDDAAHAGTRHPGHHGLHVEGSLGEAARPRTACHRRQEGHFVAVAEHGVERCDVEVDGGGQTLSETVEYGVLTRQKRPQISDSRTLGERDGQLLHAGGLAHGAEQLHDDLHHHKLPDGPGPNQPPLTSHFRRA